MGLGHVAALGIGTAYDTKGYQYSSRNGTVATTYVGSSR